MKLWKGIQAGANEHGKDNKYQVFCLSTYMITQLSYIKFIIIIK